MWLSECLCSCLCVCVSSYLCAFIDLAESVWLMKGVSFGEGRGSIYDSGSVSGVCEELEVMRLRVCTSMGVCFEKVVRTLFITKMKKNYAKFHKQFLRNIQEIQEVVNY